jgi:hypothetical protein
MELDLVDVNEVEKTLELRQMAASAAENSAIKSQDTAFDDGQNTVVQYMGDRLAKGREKTSESLEHHNKRLGVIVAELESFPRQSFSDTVMIAVNMTLRGHDEELKKTQGAEDQSAKAFKAYRLRFGIQRLTRYPEWRVKHWAIVFVLFFLESVANSQFFAKASPFGLIGGLLQAGIISAINIGTGLLGGMTVFPWRNRWEVENRSTNLPSLVAIGLGCFLLLFNLGTAHYRVLLEDMPKQAIKLAIAHLFRTPFSIDNFDAWVLLFVGVMFTSVAWIEGYKSDDPLREYGRLFRRYENARNQNAETKTLIREAVVNQITEKKKELINTARQFKIMLADYSAEIDRYKADAKHYRSWRNRIEEATRTLLSRYRSYYLTVDNLDPKPTYFDQEYFLPDEDKFLEEDKRIKLAEDRIPDLEGIVNDIQQIKSQGMEEEKQLTEDAQKETDDFFNRILGIAAKESDEVVFS